MKKWASLFAKKGTFLIAIFRTLLFTIYSVMLISFQLMVIINSSKGFQTYEAQSQANTKSEFFLEKKTSTNPSDPEKEIERKSLIEQIITLADKRAKYNKQSAYMTYAFAMIYSDNDDLLEEKQNKLNTNMWQRSELEMKNFTERMRKLGYPSIFQEWPKPEVETDCIELRLLMDSTLVGDLRCNPLHPPTIKSVVNLFVFIPSMTLEDAQSKYGKPSIGEKYDEVGNKYITYGRIRLIANESENIFAVFYSLNDIPE